MQFKLIDIPKSSEHKWIQTFEAPSELLLAAGYDVADLKQQPFKCCKAVLTALAQLILWPDEEVASRRVLVGRTSSHANLMSTTMCL